MEEYEEVESFNFLNKFWDILFKPEQDDSLGRFTISSNIFHQNTFNKNFRKNKSEQIKKLYDLLIEHREFLKTKILIDSNNYKKLKILNFAIDTYKRIESYILHFLLLIRILSNLKDPISFIKADQALKILGSELFIIKGSNKTGLLVNSIELIIKRFLDELQSKNIYQTIIYIYNNLIRFLNLISSIMKISLFLEDNTIYQKSLSFYDKIFNISLRFLTQGRDIEKNILKSNLHFNIANIFVKYKFFYKSL